MASMFRLLITASAGSVLSLLLCCQGSSVEHAVVLAGPSEVTKRPNVLFIVIDDLRPQLGCYGLDFMHTPNIDSLAERGVLFERAFCMVAICGASRASVMTGLRPSARRFRSYATYASVDAPKAVPLNTWFKQNGYETISLGKVYHMIDDHAEGWSEEPWRSELSDYRDTEAYEKALAEFSQRYPKKTAMGRGAAFESVDAPDESYPDGECTTRAIEYLERFAQHPEKPFFLAVGLRKPHLPFTAPKKYWDLYDPASIDLPPNAELPTDVPVGATHHSGELRAFSGIPTTEPIGREIAIQLIHAYYACVSFIDSQVGRMLGALDELELADDTVIVLWGDHGYQLGEHGMWNKHSCFETSMHAPLIIAAPQAGGVAVGGRVPALIEFTAIYPTLCELTGLPKPKHLQGLSVLPFMENPRARGRLFSIGRYGAGDTIRTDRFRYSEYRNKRGLGELTGRMLFDLELDPREQSNLLAPGREESAEVPASLVEALSKYLNRVKGTRLQAPAARR